MQNLHQLISTRTANLTSNIDDFTPGMKVVYVALHVQERLGPNWREVMLARETQPDPRVSNHFAGIEVGVVSSHNSRFVFVKYWPQLNRLGWNGTTSQATSPDDLVIISLMADVYIKHQHNLMSDTQRRQHDETMYSVSAQVPRMVSNSRR